MDFEGHLLGIVRESMEAQKQLADRAMEQLTDEQLHWSPHPESNSIAT